MDTNYIIEEDENVLEVRNLSKRFTNKQVLSDISFCVRKGSIFALIGPNGAGKTTTIKCILDVISKDSGEVVIFGEHFKPYVKKEIAVVSEDRRVLRNFTANDYEKLWASLYKNWNKRTFDVLMSRYSFNLAQKVDEYSIGMKTLFFVILAISSGSSLLILDEPTQHLDPTIRFEIMDLIKNAAKEGRTILVSSHEIFELEEYATDFAIIKSGVVIYTDSLDEAKEKHRVIGRGENFMAGEIIGLLGDELLVRLNENTINVGRYPKFNDIVVGYLNSKVL
ncbi:MAG: ABC transporter ATP-binding protein [Fervidobacterium sp.]|nr:ABC transporter ATP-binding protein [Fervidobacterium sp.]